MGVVFNAEEIFKIAEQIERNGAKFYKKASERFDNESQKRKLLDLAAMELAHEQIFASMRKKLLNVGNEETVFDPYGEAETYLQAFADGHVFDLTADPSKKLTGKKSLEDILNMAIGIEKDSVVFYVGIRDVVPPDFGKDKVDKIIREEMGHITLLSKELAALA